jgi:HD-GYP domain-containing protein (c-di-GMP phosphodiesterase class II)
VGTLNASLEPQAILQRSRLFGSLDPALTARLTSHFAPVVYQLGEIIYREGEPGDAMLIIGEGEVEVVKLVGQSGHVLSRLGPGEHVGEMAMISSEKRSATIRAASMVYGLTMNQVEFDLLLDDEPLFAREMLRAISDRLRLTDESALEQMVTAHQALTFALAKLADSRDPETGGHLYRVREYCVTLARLLRDHPKYCGQIDDEFIENIYLVAPLHDIGKVAIPDGILLKKGRLTDAEFEIMSKHTTLGAHAVDTVLEFCDFELFRMAKRVILGHHERYDGLGYPRGVHGEDIPLEARIMTLADIYDALLSARVYKPAFSYDEAKQEIRNHAGSRFDPDMVDVMLAHMPAFEAIHRRFSEETPDYSTVD